MSVESKVKDFPCCILEKIKELVEFRGCNYSYIADCKLKEISDLVNVNYILESCALLA